MMDWMDLWPEPAVHDSYASLTIIGLMDYHIAPSKYRHIFKNMTQSHIICVHCIKLLMDFV